MLKTLPVLVTTYTHFEMSQSEPNAKKFVWSYEITITNESSEIVQLLGRAWRITEMTGRVEEIQGLGVVSMQPLIKPGRKFTYSSYCQLTTPQGTMEGFYEMQNLEEQTFKVEIPKFVLCAPSHLTKLYRNKLH